MLCTHLLWRKLTTTGGRVCVKIRRCSSALLSVQVSAWRRALGLRISAEWNAPRPRGSWTTPKHAPGARSRARTWGPFSATLLSFSQHSRQRSRPWPYEWVGVCSAHTGLFHLRISLLLSILSKLVIIRKHDVSRQITHKKTCIMLKMHCYVGYVTSRQIDWIDNIQ